jgi:hypothetical protein
MANTFVWTSRIAFKGSVGYQWIEIRTMVFMGSCGSVSKEMDWWSFTGFGTGGFLQVLNSGYSAVSGFAVFQRVDLTGFAAFS